MTGTATVRASTDQHVLAQDEAGRALERTVEPGGTRAAHAGAVAGSLPVTAGIIGRRSRAVDALPPAAFGGGSIAFADVWPLERPPGFEGNPQPLFSGDR